MLFNTIEFLVFFPIVVFLFFLIPHKYRWILLLGASYYFYMCWKVEYIILIIISTLIDYFAALQMSKLKDRSKRKRYLYLSLISNLGILFGFKYFNFFSENFRDVLDFLNISNNLPYLHILLPVGISFYTFQTLSYTIDVYMGKKKPEKHLGIFALYVSFFPQLVAGPIERSSRLLPQFYKKQEFDYDNVVNGLRLILWGFFKKVVIADRLAVFVNMVYNSPGEYYGMHIILATIFFAFQIYCDFSGYSDIAIGVARVMGYELMENFNKPYFAKSISDFWKRWHISLSSWFRDYLYIPLGGNRVVKWRWYYNLIATFVISGLWHGANWTFVLWGLIHGIYLVFAIVTKSKREFLRKKIGLNRYPRFNGFMQIYSTLILVLFAWIFFRANNISDAFLLIKNMLNFDNSTVTFKTVWNFEVIFSIILIVFLELVNYILKDRSISGFISEKQIYLRWGIYLFLVLSVLYLGKYNVQDFIYFQF